VWYLPVINKEYGPRSTGPVLVGSGHPLVVDARVVALGVGDTRTGALGVTRHRAR
jgi:hypothetical protein